MTKFYFGAALSSHQVEGNNIHNDWWEFERKLHGKNLKSGIATNHYELFEEDFKLAKQLGHNAHRFSIEWSRIEPEEGLIDKDAIEHYKKVLQSLEQNGLEPIVTLWHFTMPLWFARKGGFEKRENIPIFVNYCKNIVSELKDHLGYIQVINEPNVYAYQSYLIGLWPPCKKSMKSYKIVMKNMILAYKEVYDELKKINPAFKISIAKSNQFYSPERKNNVFDKILTAYFRYQWNFYFLDNIKNQLDFIGLNYYFHSLVKADLKLKNKFFQYSYPSKIRTDMNWEVYPQGIYDVLAELHHRYKKPLIVTENGVADSADKIRPDYIKQSLEAVFKAKKDGMNIFGYIHWALTDNFEWNLGLTPRFGLIEIDYKTLQRKIRPSALVYKDLIENYN